MNQRVQRGLIDDDGIGIQDVKAPNISESCSLFVLFTATFLLCAVMVLNVFLDQQLFIMGINFIYDYQSKIPYSYFHTIQNSISLFAHSTVIGVILLVYYIVVNRKILLMVHLSYFIFATYIIAVLKQAFQQSRPIWYDNRINNWQWFCWKDFGNPSGHSFAVMVLYQPIISDSIGYSKYRPWTYILVLLFVLVPLSRMYLGVHSLNQILFGLSLGTLLLILYKYIYQKALYYLYWQFLLSGRKFVKILGIVLLHIIVILIPIVFYYINRAERPMLQKDIQNLNRQCKKSFTGQYIQTEMMVACSVGCLTFGLLYGFILLSDQRGYRKYLLGLWAYESKLKFFLKIGIYFLCAGIPIAIFYALTYVNQNPYFHYIMLCIGVTTAGLGLSYFAPIVTSRCNIMKLLPGSAQDYEHRLTLKQQK